MVGYNPNITKAAEFVFNDTLICDTAEIANRVTFADAVRVRSVTLAGDVYDPSGSLSGGSAAKGSGLLIKVQQLLEAEQQLVQATAELEEIEKEHGKAQKAREEWRARAGELDMKEHELKLMEEQVQGSNAAQVRFQSPCLFSS